MARRMSAMLLRGSSSAWKTRTMSGSMGAFPWCKRITVSNWLASSSVQLMSAFRVVAEVLHHAHVVREVRLFAAQPRWLRVGGGLVWFVFPGVRVQP